MCVIKETFLEGTKSRSSKYPCREYLATAKCSTFGADSLQTQEQGLEAADGSGQVCGKGQAQRNDRAARAVKGTQERTRSRSSARAGDRRGGTAGATGRSDSTAKGWEPVRLHRRV